MSAWKSWAAPTVLVVIGCVQMVGDLAGLPALRGIGAASAASPAPKVFTAQEGFETYSGRFYVSWQDPSGKAHELHLTPQVYANVAGPYNRRNAYGAALSYGPVLYDSELTRPMFNAAIQHTFCGNSSILKEIGIDRKQTTGRYQFELKPRQKLPAGHKWKLQHEVICDA